MPQASQSSVMPIEPAQCDDDLREELGKVNANQAGQTPIDSTLKEAEHVKCQLYVQSLTVHTKCKTT